MALLNINSHFWPPYNPHPTPPANTTTSTLPPNSGRRSLSVQTGTNDGVSQAVIQQERTSVGWYNYQVNVSPVVKHLQSLRKLFTKMFFPVDLSLLFS